MCWLKLEKWTKAAETCTDALKLDAANGKALFRRATAYEQLGEVRQGARRRQGRNARRRRCNSGARQARRGQDRQTHRRARRSSAYFLEV
jgi:hypothetical protein